MSEPLSPELEQKAQELASRIRSRSSDAILEMARRLVTCSEETLFGETEFALRKQALGIVADATPSTSPKKRLPGSRHRLPALRPLRPLPQLPLENGRNARRCPEVSACLLLLRVVRTRFVPVRSTCRFDRATLLAGG